MASATELQALLRFLSQDAKIPLAQAMSKVQPLTTAKLGTPSAISKSDLDTIKSIFNDDKLAKQVFSNAKRVCKKRASIGDALPAPSPKKPKPSYGQPLSPAEFEDSLALPEVCTDEDELAKVAVYTNRAPLVLAFAVMLLKYTMPAQPLSSRLSLAQAVVSANSRTKAVSIGLEEGKSAEEEGWGEGQPVVKVMGREIKVMKRWGYHWEVKEEEGASQDTVKEEVDSGSTEEPALWGVDLEVLKKQSDPKNGGQAARGGASSQLPIYTAQSARSFLLKAFETPKKEGEEKKSSPKKGAIAAEKEKNLGLLLGAIDLLMQSWSSVLSKDDMDRRAWGWYVNIRPQVESGVAGWGGRGNVKLADILALRRPAD